MAKNEDNIQIILKIFQVSNGFLPCETLKNNFIENNMIKHKYVQ